jgi:tetratricopeptide (TPR) repeat protein
MKVRVYDEDVREFVVQQKGVFIVLSHDPNFNKNLRSTMVRHLHTKDDCVYTVITQEQLHRQLRLLGDQGRRIVFFLEREINGKSCNELLQYTKAHYPQVMVVILTNEVARDALVYLHEIGASNIITKPISPDMLIEKIAFTIKPRGQIGELIDAGKSYNEHGRHEDAATLARQVLELKPNSPAAYILLGDSQRLMGQMDKARASYEEASRHGKLYLEPYRKLAELHKETGDVRTETGYLEKLDQLSPLNLERKVNIGVNYLSLGEKDLADEHFEGALKLAVKEASSQVGRVSNMIAEQCLALDPEVSEKYLRQALEARKGHLDKSDLETFNRLGITLRKQGLWHKAIEEYRKALSISAINPTILYNMSLAFSEGKKYAEACRHMDQALQFDPELGADSEIVCYNIALIYSGCKNSEICADYLRKALEINPDFQKAKAMLRDL